MKNKNHLFMLEKFKGFVFGFTFAVALVAVGVYAANTDAVQKKWKAVWHGTDWIDAGRVVRSEELAENLEWLYQKTLKKTEIPKCIGQNKALQYNGSHFVCANIKSTTVNNNKNCAAQIVKGQFYYTSCGCWSCSTNYTIKDYSCPAAKHLQTVTCHVSGWNYKTAKFQCVSGAFVQRTKAGVDDSPGGMACGSCFTKETLIAMADGSQKRIVDIQAGDKVRGKDGVINTVKGIEKVPLGGRKLYSINDSSYFVTAEHPFLTKDGWKSISPEALLKEEPSLAQKLNPKTLKVGDVLITKDGEVLVKSIKSKEAPEQTVYNLILDGNNTYYANGFLVHNKD